MIEVFVAEFSQHAGMPEFTEQLSTLSVESQEDVGGPWIVCSRRYNFDIAGMCKISRFHVVKLVLVAVRDATKFHSSMNRITPSFGTVRVVANEEIVKRKIHRGPTEDAKHLVRSIAVQILKIDHPFRMTPNIRRGTLHGKLVSNVLSPQFIPAAVLNDQEPVFGLCDRGILIKLRTDRHECSREHEGCERRHTCRTNRMDPQVTNDALGQRTSIWLDDLGE